MADDYDDFDLEAELSDELDVLETARRAIADHPNVEFVSLGPTVDDLEDAIWVRVTGDVDGLDELRDEISLDVVVVEVSDLGAGASRPVADDGTNHLQGRVNPPAAGYEIGPDPDFEPAVGTLGLVGYRTGSNTLSGNRRLVTAAHTFSEWNAEENTYEFGEDVRQPISDDQDDVIARTPHKPLAKLDVIGYSVVETARNWPDASRVADVGTGRISGAWEPRIGARVTKVGRTTGVTSGEITDINDRYFLVENPAEPIAARGDSGAPLVEVTDDGELKWIGILKSGMTYGGDDSNSLIGIRAEFVSGVLDFSPL